LLAPHEAAVSSFSIAHYWDPAVLPKPDDAICLSANPALCFRRLQQQGGYEAASNLRETRRSMLIAVLHFLFTA